MELKDQGLLKSQCYIDGQWVGADSGASLLVDNPATGEALGSVPNVGAAETRRAIEAANRAGPGWRAQTADARARILKRWYEPVSYTHLDVYKRQHHWIRSGFALRLTKPSGAVH